MLCDDCQKNEACIHITQISAEGRFHKNLCEDCAGKYGELTSPPNEKAFTVNDFLKGFLGKPIPEASMIEAQGLTCPNCGMLYQDFAHTGKLGCSACYDVFRNFLSPLLTRIHGASIHSGKIPKRSGGALVIQQQISTLKAKLQAAVQAEEYEKAVEYRDAIRALEEKLSGNGKEGSHHASD